jgi:hypothetical protein
MHQNVSDLNTQNNLAQLPTNQEEYLILDVQAITIMKRSKYQKNMQGKAMFHNNTSIGKV